MANFNLPLDPAVISSVSTGGVVGSSNVVGTLYVSSPVLDPAYIQANAAFAQANAGIAFTQVVYNFANTISGGAAIDNVARQLAISANSYAKTVSTNTVIIQGIVSTQNTNIINLQSQISSNVANLQYQISSNVNNLQSQINSNVSSLQSQINSNVTSLQSQISSNVNYLTGVTSTQNNSISYLNSFIQSSFNQANSAVTNASNASFPSGTALMFQQSFAPTGWTKSMDHNDKALRVVNGTAGSGGSVAFSSAFNIRSVTGSVSVSGSPGVSGSVGATTLDSSMIPSHAHIYPGDDQLGSAAGLAGWNGYSASGFNYDAVSNLSGGAQMWYTTYSGGGGAHSHGFSGSGSFSGAASFAGDSMNLQVNYVDVIIGTKN